jgi:hypothetical protein
MTEKVMSLGMTNSARTWTINSCFVVLLATFQVETDVRAQTPDATTEAKQHYQNAVTAIAKNNWQTAKSELQKAATLAPQNALVHYDLALAYKNLGEVASAQSEIKNALQLGLPDAQRQEGQKLAEQLQSTSTGGPSSSSGPHPSEAAGPAPAQASPVRTLNSLIKNELGATTSNYQPFNFTYETSTRKLWWTRLTGSYCQYGNSGWVALAMAGARLSELDPSGITSNRDSDGSPQIVLACKNGASCFEDWGVEQCARIEQYTHTANTYVETIDKTIKVNHASVPLRLKRRFAQLQIGTTGDPDSTEKAIGLLQRLISQAGPPSKTFLAESERQQTEERAEVARKQMEKERQDQEAANKINEQLSGLQGHWHLRYGEEKTRSGRWSNQFAPGGFTDGNDVKTYLFADHDLMISPPSGGQARGSYTITNYESRLGKSGISSLDYICFNVGSQCYTTYSWNVTQTFDVVVTIDQKGNFDVEMTHRNCGGDCSERERHLPDRSPSLELQTPYLMYFDSRKYVKQ